MLSQIVASISLSSASKELSPLCKNSSHEAKSTTPYLHIAKPHHSIIIFTGVKQMPNLFSVPSTQNLRNMKKLDLDRSMQLIELPDFCKASSLERLSLRSCANLLFVHPSIFSLQKLVYVNLNGCRSLERLPAIEALPSFARCCSKLQNLFLSECESLKYLADSLLELRFLRKLNISGCKQLDTSNLHIFFDGLLSLTVLSLGGCCKLYEVPANISNLSLLSVLSLWGTNVKTLPESIRHFTQLRNLYLRNCRRLQSLPEIPASVCVLVADDCTSLERVFTPTAELLQRHIRLYITQPNDHTCFSFKNCPNLDKVALDAIYAYASCCNNRSLQLGENQKTCLPIHLDFHNQLVWIFGNRV